MGHLDTKLAHIFCHAPSMLQEPDETFTNWAFYCQTNVSGTSHTLVMIHFAYERGLVIRGYRQIGATIWRQIHAPLWLAIASAANQSETGQSHRQGVPSDLDISDSRISFLT